MDNNNNKNMEMNNNMGHGVEEESSIDWKAIVCKLYPKRWFFLISAIVTVAVVTPLALTVPKVYKVEVKLTPELSSGNKAGGLSSLMSSFGIGGGGGSAGEDAIGPTLYPELMNSNTFLVSLFDIPVKTKDSKIYTTYFEYLSKYQKAPIWAEAMKSIINVFGHKKEEEKKSLDAKALTPKQDAIVKAISANVVCNVDKKTGVISIEVKDQDPVVCARVADCACKRLQQFITEYRSKKARLEMINVEMQYEQAKKTYEKAKEKVENFNDSNWDLVDEDMMVEQQDLQNQMLLAFQTMSAFNTQLIAARSKYQSSLPVYTVLDGASIPLKPEGPKRSLFIIIALVLVLGVEVAWTLYKDVIKEQYSDVKSEIAEQPKK